MTLLTLAFYFYIYPFKTRSVPVLQSSATPTAPILLNEDCQRYLSFFVDKVRNVRNNIFSSASMLMVPTPARPVILRSFAAVTLPASKAYWYNESLFLLSGHFTYIFVEKCLTVH